MRVSTAELRGFLEAVLRRLEDRGVREVDIEKDFYWHIPKDSWTDPYKEPKEFTMGQISDDLAELRRIASGDSEALGYAAVWLATVLRAVGEKETP